MTRRRGLAADTRGVVAVSFALSLVAMLMAIGAAIDLSQAYFARQELSAVAAMTCQYSERPVIVALAFGSGGRSAYSASVNSYASAVMAAQQTSWKQLTATPFSYAQGGAGSITLTASVPTAIMRLAGITAIPVSVATQCFAAITATPQQPVGDATALLVQEGFETAALSQLTWYLTTGTAVAYGGVAAIAPVNTPPANIGYVGSNGSEWVVMGYCLEIDLVGHSISTVPEGTHSAELDCDNGSGTAGNSSISTKVYLAAGSYELRWDYAGRITDYYYGTSFICGTVASDTSWANDSGYAGGAGARTDQINAYLDQNVSGAPPTHVTLDGTQRLAGANLIDECVYSSGWIERSVPITVTTAGYYWLSFAADGANDSAGGQIDNIRLCAGSCAGTAGADFPTSWLPASNGGNNVVLFQDTFESPTYTASHYDLSGNIGLSTGSSYVWSMTGRGWSMAGENILPYYTTGCPQGAQCIEIGWESHVGTDLAIARPFLLDPGYYQIGYDYVSENLFSGLSGTYCGATPAAAGIAHLVNGTGTATDRALGYTVGTLAWTTGTIGVFMSHAQMASEPDFSSTLLSHATYSNPDGTDTSSPTVPPNAISLTGFVQSATSPLIDICGYAATAQARTATILVQKPAFYWLMFSILGTLNGYGAIIDNVTVTALGSPGMANPPSNAVTIPVPDPQPGSSVAYSGFSIIADKY